MNISLKQFRLCFCVLFLQVMFSAASFTQQSVQSSSSGGLLDSMLRKHVYYLASEELRGREPATEGNTKAADYIAQQFREIGVELLTGQDSYFQYFTIPTGVTLYGTNTVNTISTQGKRTQWSVGKDYTPLGYSDNITTTSQVAFCGYGITHQDAQYDDYANIDVRGKIVIVFTGSPDSDNPHGKFAGKATQRAKATNAREHGAVAMIIVHKNSTFVSSIGGEDLPLPKLRFDSQGNGSGLAILHARRDAIDEILPAWGKLTTLERGMSSSGQPRSFLLDGITMELAVALSIQRASIPNVVGVISGTNPAKRSEYIVLGAHFDHLGMGDEHSLYAGMDKRIHYGADDNASGTAGIIEIARLLKNNPPERSVILTAFNAEEKGLLGSIHFTQNPLVGIDSIVCMMNMDMIGRLEQQKLSIQGVGTTPVWDSLIRHAAIPYSLVLSTTADGLGPSDHSSFYTKGKPVLFFFTGLHSDYHRPSDTPDKINYIGQSQIVHYVRDIIISVANAQHPPVFTKVATTQQQTSGGFGVTFGVIPDYSDNPKGLRITGVREGSPAEKAGLRADDILISFASTSIKNVYDLTYELSQRKPGDVVRVSALRIIDGKEHTVAVEVLLTARK